MSNAKEREGGDAKKGRKRSQVLILLGVVVVNLGLYGALWMLSQGSGPVSKPPAVTVSEQLPMRSAFGQALALAQGWQSDAQLTSAATSWQVAAGDRLTLERPAWSFTFYSPTGHQVKVVTVDPRGAHAGPQQSVDVAPYRVAPDWSMGSDALLLTFLSYGGEAFLSAHPGANIHLQLKGDETERSIWYITGLDPVARQALLVGVDARSRQVILSENTAGGA